MQARVGTYIPSSHTGTTQMTNTYYYGNKVSNADALEYVIHIKNTKPKLWSKIRAEFERSNQVLSSRIKNHGFPIFAKRLVDLCEGNRFLARDTVLNLRSNACPVCGNPASKTGITCSKKCGWDIDTTRADRRSKTWEGIYGVSHPRKLQHIVDKANETCLERYGGGPLGNPDVQAKIKERLNAKYGPKVNWTSQIPGVLKDRWIKTEETCLQRYGVRSIMQVPFIFRKNQMSRYSTKKWVDKFGKPHWVQGYEPQVLDYLQSVGMGPFNTEPKPKPYVKDSELHSYTPDFCFIDPNGRRVYVEVKSSWTINPENTRDWKSNLAKFKAMNSFCNDRGFTFVLAIATKRFGVKPLTVAFPTEEKLLALQRRN
jgi:hypothetical protein